MPSNRKKTLFLIIPIILILGVMIAFLSCTAKNNNNQYETFAKFHPRTWYNDRVGFEARVNKLGTYAAYISEYNLYLKEKQSDKAINLTRHFGYDWSWGINWVLNGEDLQYNRMISGENPTKERLSKNWLKPLPPTSTIPNQLTDYSEDGSWVIYNGSSGIWAFNASDSSYKLVVPDVTSRCVTMNPVDTTFAYLILNDSGLVDIFTADIQDSTTRKIASGLDGQPMSQPMEYSIDGRLLYLSLASTGSLNLKDRHQPVTVDRNLKVFSLEIESGNFELVIDNPGDNYIAGINDSEIFWTNVQTLMRIGLAPAEGGETQLLTDQLTSLAFWSPDGSKLSAMYGDWRNADWAINWDLGVYQFDESTATVSELKPTINGYHEDYALTFSPNGRWLAYHSHRSDIPVARYHNDHATDDIYLKAVTDDEEIRLTDFGREAGTPDWAPDNKRILFCSIGENGLYRPWIITIDSINGQPLKVDSLLLPEEIGTVTSAVWSPNGIDIALDVTTGDKGEHEIWIVDDQNSKAVKVCEFTYLPELGGLDFSPDGSKVYYAALKDEHHKIFSVDIASLDTKLVTGLDNHEMIWPQVSPNGKFVSFTLYQHTYEIRSMKL